MDVPHVALNFLTGKPRNAAIQELEALCQSAEVFILDFHMFSNSSLSVQFESDASGVLSLARSLEGHSIKLMESSRALLGSVAKLPAGDKVRGTIQISFMSEDGDLRIEVPMVPG